MAVRFVLSIAGIFYRALQLLPFANKIFYCDSGTFAAANKIACNEQYRSTAHRRQFCRAL